MLDRIWIDDNLGSRIFQITQKSDTSTGKIDKSHFSTQTLRITCTEIRLFKGQTCSQG